MLFEPILLFALGLALLTGGAELLVQSATRLATGLGVSPLVVGLTVVAFATSAPEAAVSVQAALSSHGDVALGNVVGSNVFNVLVVLGISAVILPLRMGRRLLRFDVPFMVGASALPLLLGLDGSLARLEGGGLFLLLLGYVGLITWMAVRNRGRPEARRRETGPDSPGREMTERTEVDSTPKNGPAEEETRPGLLLYLLLMGAGVGLLLLGADLLVEGASDIARILGAGELVVGLTLVAGGTSLPEAATSLMATLRGQRDLAVGNVVGSNIFNVLGVLGVASAVSPAGLAVPTGALTFDFLVMFAVALVCVPVFLTGRVVSRWEGGFFLAYYTLYLVYLGLDAAEHGVRSLFGSSVLYVVLPLTLLAALTGWLRSAEPD